MPDLETKGSLYPTFTDLEDDYSLQEFISAQQQEPLSYSSIFKISAEEAFQDTFTTSLFRMYDLGQVRKISEGTETYSAEEANSKFAQYGLKFNKPVTKIEAEYLADKKYKSILNRQMMQDGVDPFLTGATSFAGGMFGAMADPIGIAASVIPITKIVPGLKAMAASKSLATRLGANFIDASIGNAIIEPMPIIAAQYDQRDYTAVDSMANIFAGGLFGVGFGALGEGFKYMSRGNKYNTLGTGLKEYSNGLVPKTMQSLEDGAQTVTGLSYKQLIDLPNEVLTKTNDPKTGEIIVQLNDDNILGSLQGRGITEEAAKQNLRYKYGTLLENEDLIHGYNKSHVTKVIEQSIFEKFGLDDIGKVSEVIAKLQEQNPNFIHYLYTSTDGLKNIDSFIDNLGIKPGAKPATTLSRVSKSLDQAIEAKAAEVAKRIELNNLLNKTTDRLPSMKELFKQIQEQSRLFETESGKKRHIDAITERQRKATNEGTNLVLKLQELEYKLSEKTKQLDSTNKIHRQDILKREIEQLNNAINTTKNDINNLESYLNIKTEDLLATRQSDIVNINKLIKQLEQDPRGIMELRDIINKSQQNTEKLFIEPEETKERDNFLEQHKDPAVAELNTEAMDNLKDVTMYMEKYNSATRKNLGLLDENVTKEIKLIQQEADDLAQFKKDYLDYIECRRTESNYEVKF